MRFRTIVPAFLFVLGGVSSLGLAQPVSVAGSTSPATFPVIVELRDEGIRGVGVGQFTLDSRFTNRPELLYHDRATIAVIQSLEKRYGFQSTQLFSRVLKGFSAKLTTAQIQSLEFNPFVKSVAADQPVGVDAQTVPWGVNKIDADQSTHRAGDGVGAVSGVNAYVIDTGLDTSNADLNVMGHVNFAGGSNRDCHGHGTHVGGTLGARDNTTGVVGVAAGIGLYGVKVLGCRGFGSESAVIAGIDWVTANARKPAVANMSLSGSKSTMLDAAVRNSVAAGVFYAVAAGNSGADACASSPANLGQNQDNGVMTVGATDSDDVEAPFSNFGSCVDIWAPGVDIVSTKMGSASATRTLSGTSMASPHVAGAAALLLAKNPTATPAQVESQLRNDQTMTGTKSRDGRAMGRVYAGRY